MPIDPEDPNRPPRRWSLGRTAGYSLVVVGAFIAAQTLVVSATLAAKVAGDPDLNVEAWADGIESNGLVLWLSTVATALACVPLVRFLAGRRESDAWGFLGVRPAEARSVAIWCLGLVAFVVASDTLTVALGRPVVPEFMAEAYAASAQPLLLFAALVVFAPAFEEIFFRGFLLSALESSGLPVTIAALVSSTAWAIIHLQYDFYGIATILVMGMMFAAARIRTRSLVPCLAMHALANTIAFAEAVLLAAPAAASGT